VFYLIQIGINMSVQDFA